MIRMMVGLMGREALTSISSSVMPMMDRSTIARSSWFHLENGECSSLSGGTGYGGGCHGSTEKQNWEGPVLFICDHYPPPPIWCFAMFLKLNSNGPPLWASQHAETTSSSHGTWLHLSLFSACICLLCAKHCLKSSIPASQL